MANGVGAFAAPPSFALEVTTGAHMLLKETRKVKKPVIRPKPTLIGLFIGKTVQEEARRKALLGILFILPTMVGILVFTAGPILVSLGLSLFQWNVFQPAVFIGLQNYTRFFTDSQALASFANTIKFVFMAVASQIVLGLILAMAVEDAVPKKLRYYFRSAFFLPMLTSAASISIVLSYMFQKDFGPVNYYLGLINIPPVPWLASSSWALITVAIVYVWQTVGFNFILFIGGLSNIPRDIRDAADVDGAKGWARFFNITLPMISPSILFAGVTGAISALQVFEHPYVLTRGGPGDASRTAVMIIYESAFKHMEIGYGATSAVFLFVVILIVTAVQFGMSKRWVYYQ
jgi:multiple sugar transport system permease protein